QYLTMKTFNTNEVDAGQIKSKIFEAQHELEKLQRKEEDELMEKFWADCSGHKKSLAQQITSTMVNKHSEQMMSLLKQLQEEIRKMDPDDIAFVLAEVNMVPTEVSKFHPPTCRKRDLYNDPAVFKELDNYVFSTFTDLVAELTQNCAGDLEKARAIFRWITMKDLNVLEFKEGLGKDTPMGLLRGIKYGTEGYHTLFMRLCSFSHQLCPLDRQNNVRRTFRFSYAGLPCVYVEGHGKGVGYEPGMAISANTFWNIWNLVLIGGNWWPVECQWGARHLNTKENGQQNLKTWKPEDLHYKYDEFYFFADPDEFIHMHRADDEEKQLLKKPVTLEQFVEMPFMKPVFFQKGLQFDRPMKAVLYTDNKGSIEVKVRLSSAKDITFLYNLLYADSRKQS
ncbi:Hillarin, partial [Lamellibrachia satsuma]